MTDFQDINNLNPTPTALITGADKVPFYNTSDAKAYAMTMDQLQTWVLAGGTIDPTFDDVTCDTLTASGTISGGSPISSTVAVGSAALRLNSTNANISARNWAVASNVNAYGDFAILQSTAQNGDPLTAGTIRQYIDGAGNVGIGTASPATRLHVDGADGVRARISATSGGTPGLSLSSAGVTNWTLKSGNGDSSLRIDQDGTDRLTIAGGGNLGLGVTPSAWGADTKAIQLGGSTFSAFAGNFRFLGLANATWDGTNFRYINTAPALQYRMSAGTNAHEWYTAPSGTAGNAISFTQAMTLDASGNLGVGTGAGSLTARLEVKSAGKAMLLDSGTASDSRFELAYNGTTQGLLGVDNGQIILRASASSFLSIGAGNTERARVKAAGQVRFIPLAADPGGAEAGDVYYNSGTNKLKVYNGTAWVDLH